MLLSDQNRIHLALGVHNHQPIGNWDRVVEDAFQQAYLPFVDVLERHPRIKMTLHYSGHLLAWLAAEHPEFVARLRELVAKGQIELLTGGYYEPVLSMIPDDDRLAQLAKQSQAIHAHVGQPESPGAWLAGRTWEPHLAKPLAQSGVRYTLVDDIHFRAAGLAPGAVYGHYVTEELGHALSLFPNHRALRALIPFQPPEKVIEHLRAQATSDGARLAVAFDDGEKFGVWPNAYQAVYIEGWLDGFFTALEENADWIELVTLGEYHARHRAWGRIYLPSASHQEMQAWALPSEAGVRLDEARATVDEPYRDFLRGGYWRNFLTKYPEANVLHKKMLRVAERLERVALGARPLQPGQTVEDALSEAEDRALAWARAKDALWRAQSHDPYWHGVYGGIYLNHLRQANHRALIEACVEIDRLEHGKGPFSKREVFDLDRDGAAEVLVDTAAQGLMIAPGYGGALFGHDLKREGVNVLDTLARRPEAYHKQITGAALASEADSTLAEPGETPVSKEPGLERFLHYDWYRRYAFLDHFFHADTRLETLQNMSFGEQGDFVNQPYAIEPAAPEDAKFAGQVIRLRRDGHVWVGSEFWPVRVEKVYRVPAQGVGFAVEYAVTNLREKPVSLWFGVELNWNVPGGRDAERAFYTTTGRTLPQSHLAAAATDERLLEIGLRASTGLELHLAWNVLGDVWRFPLETVSRSEAGFERVYQSSVVLPNWRLALAGSGQWRLRLDLEVQS